MSRKLLVVCLMSLENGLYWAGIWAEVFLLQELKSK